MNTSKTYLGQLTNFTINYGSANCFVPPPGSYYSWYGYEQLPKPERPLDVSCPTCKALIGNYCIKVKTYERPWSRSKKRKWYSYNEKQRVSCKARIDASKSKEVIEILMGG